MTFLIIVILLFNTISIYTEVTNDYISDKLFINSLVKNNNELIKINKDVRLLSKNLEFIKFHYKIKENFIYENKSINKNFIYNNKDEILKNIEKDIKILSKIVNYLKLELNELMIIYPIDGNYKIKINKNNLNLNEISIENLKIEDGLQNQFEEIHTLSRVIREIYSEINFIKEITDK